MTANVLDLGSVFCLQGNKGDESCDNIYDALLGHSDDTTSCTAQPLVATTITLEAIQNILWANGFSIEPSSSADILPGPFEDTRFDVVVDVETTEDKEGDKLSAGTISSVYGSVPSEEDLSVLPDIPLSPAPSVISDSDFDFSSCDSGIEAESDELPNAEDDREQKWSKSVEKRKQMCENEITKLDKNEGKSTEACHSCIQNRFDGSKTSSDDHHIQKERQKGMELHKEENMGFDCQYLWEFLQHLLADNKYDNCIVWKNERRGIFRLTDHQRVASLWGIQKKRKNMTYDKLSRALRYYYSRNVLKKVDGQRLTYKFCRKLDGKKFAS